MWLVKHSSGSLVGGRTMLTVRPGIDHSQLSGIKTAEFKRFFARPGAASFTDDISFVDDTTEEPEIDDMTNIISRL